MRAAAVPRLISGPRCALNGFTAGWTHMVRGIIRGGAICFFGIVGDLAFFRVPLKSGAAGFF